MACVLLQVLGQGFLSMKHAGSATSSCSSKFTFLFDPRVKFDFPSHAVPVTERASTIPTCYQTLTFASSGQGVFAYSFFYGFCCFMIYFVLHCFQVSKFHCSWACIPSQSQCSTPVRFSGLSRFWLAISFVYIYNILLIIFSQLTAFAK